MLYNIFQSFSIIKLKRIYCEANDEKFLEFISCSNNGGILSLYTKLLQIPVTNCLLQMEFSSITASPLKFNTTWNACDFMKNPRRFRALSVFYDIIGRFSNLNHSCPYDVSTFK